MKWDNKMNDIIIQVMNELTPPAPWISERCIKIKNYLKFLFSHFFGASEGFMKVPQRSVKIKVLVNFICVRDQDGKS